VLRNSGGANPGFSETDYQVSPDNGHSLDGLAVADFDGDGKPDVATSDAQGGQIFVSLNHGDGSFAPPVAITGNGGPLAAADIDGDGKPDLVVGYATGGAESTVAVLLNEGHGTFGAPTRYTVQGNSISQIVPTDLNGDGKMDLVTIDYSYSGGSLLLNKGSGTFGAGTAMPGATLYSPLFAAAGDFSGTGVGGIAVSLLYNDFGVTTFSGKCP